jgi:hypothetical protein
MMKNTKRLVTALLIICTVSIVVVANKAVANYSFPYKDKKITMDVVKTYGGGGTWVCPSVRACYVKVLEAEARGAAQYCESITIKRDGRVVWWRKYH